MPSSTGTSEKGRSSFPKWRAIGGHRSQISLVMSVGTVFRISQSAGRRHEANLVSVYWSVQRIIGPLISYKKYW